MLHRADDLLPEENDVVQTALKRLQPQDAYNRVFRLRRAMQVHGPPLERTRRTMTYTSVALHDASAPPQGGVDQGGRGETAPASVQTPY